MLQKKASRTDEHSLSFGQERLWLIARLDPGSSLYHIAVAYRVKGPLDLTLVKECVSHIAERHEVLRATFPAGKDQPVQKVALQVPSVFSVTELGIATDGERGDGIVHLALKEAKRPFDLGRGPLWHVTVFRRSDKAHYIVLTMHHIVSDAWSVFIFCQELAELYDAAASGRPARLTPAADPVCRFWQTAAPVALRPGPPAAVGPLADASVGRYSQAPVTDRSPEIDGDPPSRCGSNPGCLGTRIPGLGPTKPAQKRDHVHDPLGRLRGPVASVQRPGRSRYLHANIRPSPLSHEGLARLLQ